MNKTETTQGGNNNYPEKGFFHRLKEKSVQLKEKVIDTLEYKKLKLKEYYGKLDQEGFDQLLVYDFKSETQDNPPIEGEFSPEGDLARIRQLPKEEKRAELSHYKEKLATQREAWANCRVFIERQIEFNHDVAREKLVETVNKFAESYGFTAEQKNNAEQLIDDYYATRARVIALREKYHDNKELVSNVTGVKFTNTEFDDVSVGPMSIDITTDGVTANKIYSRLPEDVEVLPLRSLGLAMNRDTEMGNIPSTLKNKDKAGESTLPHEHEHIKNKLFRRLFDKKFSYGELFKLQEAYDKEKDPDLKRELLRQYLQLERLDALNRAKDEITAMAKGVRKFGTKENSISSYINLFTIKDKDLGYDYLHGVREKKLAGQPDEALWKEETDAILVKEYDSIIKNAFVAFQELKEKGGYTQDETIAMFTDKPLNEWPKVTARMLAEKEKVKPRLKEDASGQLQKLRSNLEMTDQNQIKTEPQIEEKEPTIPKEKLAYLQVGIDCLNRYVEDLVNQSRQNPSEVEPGLIDYVKNLAIELGTGESMAMANAHEFLTGRLKRCQFTINKIMKENPAGRNKTEIEGETLGELWDKYELYKSGIESIEAARRI